MNRILLTLIGSAALTLAACSQKVETSVAPAAASGAAAPAATAASTPAPAPAAEAQTQTLTSRDNAVSITLKGNFTDQSSNAALLPEGMGAEEITLLQQDGNGTVLYVADLGKPAKDSKTYYGQLKAALESGSGLQNLKIGAQTENRLNYSFSQNGLNESCLAIYTADKLYNVCASGSAPADQLADALKDVKLQQPAK